MKDAPLCSLVAYCLVMSEARSKLPQGSSKQAFVFGFIKDSWTTSSSRREWQSIATVLIPHLKLSDPHSGFPREQIHMHQSVNIGVWFGAFWTHRTPAVTPSLLSPLSANP